MFPRPPSQCFYLKRRLFRQNQHIFVERLPIDFFYFEDFRWSIFGKFIGQKYVMSSPRITSCKRHNFFIERVIIIETKEKRLFFTTNQFSYIKQS